MKGRHVINYTFEELADAPLFIDCVYQSGFSPTTAREVLSRLMGCGNLGGFRPVSRTDAYGKKHKLPAYVVLVMSTREPEWPDFLDVETGVLHYYGDNRQAGIAIDGTPGNRLLERVFELLHQRRWHEIPPFFIFKQTGHDRDVQFLGLAAPGNPSLSSDQDLVAFWRSMGERRFQNYEAFFTILDTGNEAISKQWLQSLRHSHSESQKNAPDVWRQFVQFGREGIKPLKAPKVRAIPSREEQTACENEEGRQCVLALHDYFRQEKFYYGFEACAAGIVSMMDSNFVDFQLTRPWRDGGRDALGYYKIYSGSSVNPALRIDCALEAKCYGITQAVGVREMSRLISRIRHRQFGILVTTSYVHHQAYEEVINDGHPILIITARDIARILLNHSITTNNLREWIESVQMQYSQINA